MARISRGALTANARDARHRGTRSYDSAILAADAWGHGAELVQSVLESEGLTPLDDRVSTHHRATATGTDVLCAVDLFGLPGAPTTTVPVLRLTGTVLTVKDLRAGEGVSYGYAYRASADTRVALVTGGYAQGIVRALGGAIDVEIAGERHPVIGRIAMDVCVVDIADAVLRRGDEALFLGDPGRGEPSLGEWVRVTGLTPAELITVVGLRSARQEAP